MFKTYPIIKSSIWNSTDGCTLWNSNLNPKAKEFVPLNKLNSK